MKFHKFCVFLLKLDNYFHEGCIHYPKYSLLFSDKLYLFVLEKFTVIGSLLKTSLNAIVKCMLSFLQKNNIKLELVDESYTKLRGEISGPPDTPYEGS